MPSLSICRTVTMTDHEQAFFFLNHQTSCQLHKQDQHSSLFFPHYFFLLLFYHSSLQKENFWQQGYRRNGGQKRLVLEGEGDKLLMQPSLPLTYSCYCYTHSVLHSCKISDKQKLTFKVDATHYKFTNMEDEKQPTNLKRIQLEHGFGEQFCGKQFQLSKNCRGQSIEKVEATFLTQQC